MTRRTLLDTTTETLTRGGVENARRVAEWIAEEVTGADRAALYAADHEVTPDQQAQARAMTERRISGEPIQYVLGHADFYGLRLAVSPAVLIPRPETEEVVETALGQMEAVEAPWVLDVGTGSGAIALAIRHVRPDAEVFAADVSPNALAVARANAERLGLDIAFVEADALRPSFVDRVPPAFDLIVSNPPYVPASEQASLQREVRDHEPEAALFVSDADPLVFYRALVGHAAQILAPGGWLVVETHADYGADVRDLVSVSGLTDAELRRDLSGRPRIVLARRPQAETELYT